MISGLPMARPTSIIADYDTDEDLLEAVRRDGEPRLRVYRAPMLMVVLGRGSDPSIEVDLAACQADAVELRRRRGGGCAVLLDPGNVIVSFAGRAPGFGNNRRYLTGLSAWLIDALARAGVPGVTQAGICDLVLEQQKVSGACLYRSRDLLFYSATLLVEPRVDLMARYLRHPPREPDYRRGRRHADFVGSLVARAGVTTAELVARLQQGLHCPDLETLRRPPAGGSGEGAA